MGAERARGGGRWVQGCSGGRMGGSSIAAYGGGGESQDSRGAIRAVVRWAALDALPVLLSTMHPCAGLRVFVVWRCGCSRVLAASRGTHPLRAGARVAQQQCVCMCVCACGYVCCVCRAATGKRREARGCVGDCHGVAQHIPYGPTTSSFEGSRVTLSHCHCYSVTDVLHIFRMGLRLGGSNDQVAAHCE